MTEPFKKKMEDLPFSCTKASFCQLIMAAIVGILLLPQSAFAQENKDATQQANATNRGMLYQGEVIDDEGQPLVGVAVANKDGKVVAMTDVNGIFKVWMPTANVTLSFSYVSMKKQTLRMQPGKKYTVRMQADAHQLGETVVTGIYTRKKESFTGSAASYRQEELKAIGNQNILQSLSALDPSFVIAENNLAGSNPNATMKVSINGTTSINGLSDAYGNDPDRPL